MNIIPKYGTLCTSILSGRKIEYIAIHYTAGTKSHSGKALDTAAYFASGNAGGSADFIVDDELFVQYNGDILNRYCWGVGEKKSYTKGGSLYGIATNKNTISIEICSRNSTGKVPSPNTPSWELSDKAVANAVTLARYLMDKYNVPIERVVRHYDISGKLCPGVIGWNADSGNEDKWIAFKEKLKGGDGVETYKTLADIPDWGKETVKKLIAHGSLKGEANGDLNLDRNMLRLLVINDREGCYGK